MRSNGSGCSASIRSSCGTSTAAIAGGKPVPPSPDYAATPADADHAEKLRQADVLRKRYLHFYAANSVDGWFLEYLRETAGLRTQPKVGVVLLLRATGRE